MALKKTTYIDVELEWADNLLKDLENFQKDYIPGRHVRVIDEQNHKNNKYYCYAHILLNEQLPFYIGIGTQNIKSGYFARAKQTTGRNNMWKAKVKNNNYLIIITSSSNIYEEIKLHEKDCIAILGKKIDGGLLTNISDGGDGCLGYKHTKEHIAFLKEKYTGSKNPMYGKKASEETKKKMSLSRIGKKHTEDYKIKASIRTKERGYKGPKAGNHFKAKKVCKIDINTKEIIEIYDTIILAAESLNLGNIINKAKLIGRVCKKGGTAYNFKWEYYG